MSTKQVAALATIRSAGTQGVDAWRMEGGKRVRSFSPQVINPLVADGFVEIAQDGRRASCATFYRIKAAK